MCFAGNMYSNISTQKDAEKRGIYQTVQYISRDHSVNSVDSEMSLVGDILLVLKYTCILFFIV